jgi:hypothetical protein
MCEMCVTNRNELCLDAIYFIFIITVVGITAGGKTQVQKAGLERGENWSMPQIIWVQVGPQARTRDLKFFSGRSIELPILDINLGHWPVTFHAHASIKVWNVPREFNILPSLFASLGSFGDSCVCCCWVLLVLRLACAAQLAWPGLVPRPSVPQTEHPLPAFGTDFPRYRHDDWSLMQHKNEHGTDYRPLPLTTTTTATTTDQPADRTNHDDGWG